MEKMLDPKLIDLEMTATTKREVINHLARKLFENGVVNDLDNYIKDVYLREEEGITGMGNNVAIPHGKSMGVKAPGIAIGRTKEMIEWESYDEQPVNLFFLFAVPEGKDGAEMHLKLLSQIAMKLANDEILEKLKEAQDVKEFRKEILGGI